MKSLTEIAQSTQLQFEVKSEDTAAFIEGEVHPVYATFSLGRDAEWTTRQFVLDLKDRVEEGIGTYLHVSHLAPAFVGDVVTFNAQILSLEGNHLHCSFEAWVDERKIAEGKTGQKIIPKERLKKYFNQLKHG